MAPSGTTFSPTCMASGGSTLMLPAGPRHTTRNAAAPVFGRLQFAILAGILKSAALHARAAARVLEASAETFGPSFSQSAEYTTARMEATDLHNRHQTSQHPTMCRNPDQERSHPTPHPRGWNKMQVPVNQRGGGRGHSGYFCSKKQIN
jgi:hypothetical protein